MFKKAAYIILSALAGYSCTEDPKISQDQESFQLKVFGGSNNDCCNALIAKGENLYLTGSINYLNAQDLFLIKTDKYGNEIEWSPKLYGTNNIEVGNAISTDNDKNLIAVGYTQTSPAEASDIYVVKTSPTGEELWNKRFGGARDEKAFSLNITTSNTTYIAGYTESIDYANKKRQGWILAVSSNGDSIWSHDYGFNEVDDELISVSNLGDSLLLLGTTQSKYNNLKKDVFLFILKKSTKGIENTITLYEPGNENGVSALYFNANIYVLGYTQVSSGLNNIILWKLSADLQLLDKKLITTTISETPSTLILTDNTLAVVGTAGSEPNQNFLVYTFDTNLNIISRSTYGTNGKGSQRGMTGAVSGKSIVIGGCTISGNSSKACIYKTPAILP